MIPPRRVVPRDVYAFGNGPRGPRENRDITVDDDGMFGPEGGAIPRGASVTSDPDGSPLTGPYCRLPAGTELPEGFEIIADGRDVNRASPHAAGHHTIYPSARMPFDEFLQRFRELGWVFVDRKRR